MPKLKLGEEHAQRDSRSQEFRQIGRDNGHLRENVQWVEPTPSIKQRVLRSVVQKQPAMCGKVCKIASVGLKMNKNTTKEAMLRSWKGPMTPAIVGHKT